MPVANGEPALDVALGSVMVAPQIQGEAVLTMGEGATSGDGFTGNQRLQKGKSAVIRISELVGAPSHRISSSAKEERRSPLGIEISIVGMSPQAPSYGGIV